MNIHYNSTIIKPRAKYNYTFGVWFVRYPNSAKGIGYGGVGGDLDSALKIAAEEHHKEIQKRAQ
ncbi:hypothetical protein BcepF1.006 [Burkholderia phage BcepF1]|uniref:Uncharacterized protein n=1 Tax=Burkholderia phage BcepF1 TaxID=2886897 RepID=A1YZR0_9CAUD|nr:hypothetical protein BcepF1.006 [Burkholderia phage BcepF1]ABL96737.1 hypothetical protein BcepF1.006 [Burkholderia phage BcepF1]